MCLKPIVTGLVLSSIVFATVSAQAQVSIDVSKITSGGVLMLASANPRTLSIIICPAICPSVHSSVDTRNARRS
jgi:hypothetical protein